MKLNSNKADVKPSSIEIVSKIQFDEDGLPIRWSGNIRFNRHNIKPSQLVVTAASTIEAVLLDAADGDEKFFQKMMKDVINILIACNNNGIPDEIKAHLSSLTK